MQTVKTLQALRSGGKGDNATCWKELVKKAWIETAKDSIRDRLVCFFVLVFLLAFGIWIRVGLIYSCLFVVVICCSFVCG